MSESVTLLCLASYYKGPRLIRAAHAAGATVILVTLESLRDEAWPMEAISERFLVPDLHRQPDITNAVSYLARDRKIDRIVALDEYDTVTAAQLREHLRVPGLGESTGRHFRDKLAMRVEARDSGLAVPAFVHALNHQALREFMDRVPGPWLLKPRTEASAMGIRKITDPEELWPALRELGDRQSHFLMEEFVPGDVYHVDSIVDAGQVRFSSVHKYGQPPLDVYQGGGVFQTTTISLDDPAGVALTELNGELLTAFGMIRGATHAEFIHDARDGSFKFLEVAARVGGANIDLVVEAATGVNLWEEWARVEIAHAQGRPYTVNATVQQSAGLLVCLAREEYPNLAAYDAEEVVWRLHKKHHAGLIVASKDGARVSALLAEYGERLAREHMIVAKPLSGIDEAREAGAA